jgi:hypothetical protein
MIPDHKNMPPRFLGITLSDLKPLTENRITYRVGSFILSSSSFPPISPNADSLWGRAIVSKFACPNKDNLALIFSSQNQSPQAIVIH